MYKNYIFDLYGTLVDLRTNEQREELWQKFSLFYSYNGAEYESNELKEAYLYQVKKRLDENTITEYPDIKVVSVFKLLYELKGVKTDETLIKNTTKLFRILSTEYIGLYDGVKEILKELKEKGKKVYLLSNGQREFTEPEIKYLGIYDVFDKIYCSADRGICKPDKRFYEDLLEGEKLNIDECVMVGNDHTTDIKGANNINMDSVYINSNHSHKIEGEIQSNLKIWDGNFYRLREIIK